MTDIETAAAYATSPHRLHESQYKAAPAPEPMSEAANLVLQALRSTGQYMGIFAIMTTVGAGTPGEIKRALRELEDRGLLEEQPKRDKGKDKDPAQEAQEPAQEPSTPAPAPEATEPEPTPQEPAEEVIPAQTGGVDPEAPIAVYDTIGDSYDTAEPTPLEGEFAVEWQLQTGTYSEEEGFTVREHGVYTSEEEAILTGQQYLTIGDLGELAARVRQATPGLEQWGPWIAIRHPEAPSANDTAQASR